MCSCLIKFPIFWNIFRPVSFQILLFKFLSRLNATDMAFFIVAFISVISDRKPHSLNILTYSCIYIRRWYYCVLGSSRSMSIKSFRNPLNDTMVEFLEYRTSLWLHTSTILLWHDSIYEVPWAIWRVHI